jgi:hypothetical protein
LHHKTRFLNCHDRTWSKTAWICTSVSRLPNHVRKFRYSSVKWPCKISING